MDQITQTELSSQLDQARYYEDLYRQLLLLWKRRRQSLERLIIMDSDEILDECERIAKDAFDGDSNGPNPT